MKNQQIPFWKRLFYTNRPSLMPPAGSGRCLNNAILHLHPTHVPAAALRINYTWGLGGITTTLALLLGLTGILLMFQYDPSVERAYISIQKLETQVVFGSLIRGRASLVCKPAGHLIFFTLSKSIFYGRL